MYGVWLSCLVVCLLIVLVLWHLLYILVFYRGHCKCSLSLVDPVRMLWFCFYYLLLQTNKVMMMMIMMMMQKYTYLYPSFSLYYVPFYAIAQQSGRGTVHSRPHKIFLHFHDLWTLLNKIREGVALSPLSIFL